jgi:glycerol-3-phosphate cytidylyltransferase-like family protein
MGFLTNDMARLRSDIGGLRAVRKGLSLELVQDAKVRKDAVAAMGREFHIAHAEMAKAAKQDRLTFLSGVKDSVSSLQVDFHKDLAGIREANARMARVTKEETQAFVSALTMDVSKTQAGFRNAHVEMAGKAKAGRMAFLSELKNNVSGMQEGFRNVHEAMAKSTKNSRLAFLTEIKTDVSHMQEGFRKDLADYCQTYMDMVKEARTHRTDFVEDLKKTVTDLRQQFASDINGARQAWLGSAPHSSSSPTQSGHRPMIEVERERWMEAEQAERENDEPMARTVAHEGGARKVEKPRSTEVDEHSGKEEKRFSKKEKPARHSGTPKH